MIAPAVVHSHEVKRQGRALLLTLRTDQGEVCFRLRSDVASQVGSALRIHAAPPAGERTPDPSPRPLIQKPGGGIV